MLPPVVPASPDSVSAFFNVINILPGDKMKSFIVARVKKDGVSLHKVWVNSKKAALELCWPDDSKLLGKFIVNRLRLGY